MIGDPASVFDMNGIRQAFGREAAVFGHAVAAAAYSMDLTAFQEEGFDDLSCRINSEIMTGLDFSGGPTFRDSLNRAAQNLLVKARMRYASPAVQLRGSLHPDENDHTKAVFMASGRGEYTLVVIGFTGTLKRLDDWVSNFDVRFEEGWHRGFLNLTREIEEAEEKIVFPEAAVRCGRDSLTLRDVIDECKGDRSRFRLFFAGHSQGAAVMQIYLSRLIERGVRPGYLSGIGFASPSVVYRRKEDAAEECMCHFMSSDDLICRVGARYHLGECRVLPMTDEGRAVMYGPDWEKPAFREALGIICRLKTSDEAMLMSIAALECLSREKEETSVTEEVGLLTGLKRALTEKRDQYLARLWSAGEAGYLAASGEREISPARLDACRRSVRALFGKYGPVEGFKAMVQCIGDAHRLTAPHSEGGPAPYFMMVTDRYPDLVTGLEEPLISPLKLPGTPPRRGNGRRRSARGALPWARRAAGRR